MNPEKKNLNSLVVGLGIGNLYKEVLTNLGHEVKTVDTSIEKNADFPNVNSAIWGDNKFDTAHICTPNNLHFSMAVELAKSCNIIFIEKPGVKDSAQWAELQKNHRKNRFIMVKNNQWRDDIDQLTKDYDQSDLIKLKWFNKNRIPNPGSWFTNKQLSFGGVSRDLLPHLLSFFTRFEKDYLIAKILDKKSEQRHSLETITDTDYGTVNKKGTYDVDDYCSVSFSIKNKTIMIEADWKNDISDDRCIEFYKDNKCFKKYDFGLCPESAYKNMITDCLNNLKNDHWWESQHNQDLWIHQIIENL